MSYNIYKSDGTTISIPDNVVDQEFNNTTANGGKGVGLQIVGIGSSNYVAPTAQNFLQLTENFCGSIMPPDLTALQGQLWFNKTSSTTGTLYVRVSGSGAGGIVNWREVVTGNTSVTPGAYTNASITVNSQGRIVNASNGITPITGPAGPNESIQFNNSGILAGSPALAWNGTTLIINGNLNFSGISSRISGDMTNPTIANRFGIQTSTINGNTFLGIIPNGTATESFLELENSSSRANDSVLVLFTNSTGTGLQSGVRGSGTYLPFTINTGPGGLRSITVDISGNVAVGGQSALATSATSRFLYLNSMNGTPTGTPSSVISSNGAMTGKVPVTVDTLHNQIKFYTNGEWRSSAAPNTGSAILVAGSATVLTPVVESTSKIFLTVQSLGTVTVPTMVAISNIIPGVSFTIISADVTDTSTVAWSIV